MLLIISDASVLIDVECGGLTEAMFSLPFKFAVPDVLFEEELSERHGYLLSLGLTSKSMSGELVSDAYVLRQRYSQASVNDLLALVLAKYEKCQLLTGDKALRKAAVDLNIEVHGTIWLVEKLIGSEIITTAIAYNAFQLMRDNGSRLPWNEIESMLGKYNIYEFKVS